MSENRCCCNCGHNIREWDGGYCHCHCEVHDKYMGYIEVMTGWCRRWKRDRKWDEKGGE